MSKIPENNKVKGIEISQMIDLLVMLQEKKGATHFDLEVENGKVYLYPLKFTDEEKKQEEEPKIDKPNNLFSDEI